MVNYKNFKNQNYNSLKSECVTNSKLFEDPEFPASDKSLYFSKQPPFTAEWKRPKEIDENAQMFIEGASSGDVTQGRVGNCWFVAAAASLAEEKDLWTKVIPNHKSLSFSPEKPEDYQGIFRFHFWRFGEWTEVVVDDRLPTINGELIYLKSKQENEFWSALLEKAYAKLAGSYEALEAGNPADALVDFTGGVSETIDLVKGDYTNDAEKRKELHHKLCKLMERKSMSSASIKVTNREEMEAQLETGLIKGHAYGISAVKEMTLGESFFSSFNAEKLYMVKLRNPWGKKEWNGAWSDGSPEWDKLSKKEQEKMGLVKEDDGEFWMSFEDFCHHFTTATICMLVNTSIMTFRKTYNEGALKGRWEGRSAGGCVNNKETFLHNPQFRFDMAPKKKKDVAFISLMQPDRRAEKAAGKAGNNTIGLLVMRIETNRSYKIHQTYDKAGDTTFINSREVFVRLDLEPGRYVIVPSTFEAGTEGDFLVRVYTDESNHFRELKEDVPQAGCFSFLPCCAPPQLQVSVCITGLDNLKKKGSVSMTVDPYCIMEIEGTKVRTITVPDNLNPRYNSAGVFYVKKTDSKLKIQVWDGNNLVPDTFLGEIETTLEVNNKTVLMTQSLMERKNRNGVAQKADGTLSYKLSISNNLQFM